MSKTVLIVEDNKAINLNLQCFFDDYDIPTICCFSGEEALAHIENNPDCLRAIINLRLPGMDGQKLIVQLKRLNPDMHILIHTGALDFVLNDILISLGLEEKDVFYKPQQNMDAFLDRFKEKEALQSQPD